VIPGPFAHSWVAQQTWKLSQPRDVTLGQAIAAVLIGGLTTITVTYTKAHADVTIARIQASYPRQPVSCSRALATYAQAICSSASRCLSIRLISSSDVALHGDGIATGQRLVCLLHAVSCLPVQVEDRIDLPLIASGRR
jgi:hypothetical protein